MAGKFVVKTASNGEIYFRLQAGNGETILKSEMYSSKAAALNGIESVRKNAPDDARYERKTAAGGRRPVHVQSESRQPPSHRHQRDVQVRSIPRGRHRVGQGQRAGRQGRRPDVKICRSISTKVCG